MRQFVCVEHPGHIVSQTAALQTLGGPRAIDDAFEGTETSLALNFTPGNPTAHPLYGQIYPSNNLLVKITRRRYIVKADAEVGVGDEVEGGVETRGAWHQEVEVMGSITRTCVFRGMSDFQYMIPEDPMSTLLGSLHAYDYEALANFTFERDNFITTPLRCMPPPIFSSIDHPLPYNYIQLTIAPKSTLIRNKHIKFDTVIDLTTVPTSATPEIRLDFKQKSQNFGEVVQRCKERLEVLFERHPIWSRLALLHYTEKRDVQFLMSTLPIGPFINCWVRYGVNPSSDWKYRVYQQMVTSDKSKHIRTSEQTKEANEARRSLQGGTPSHIFDGTAKLSKKYQVLHFTDVEILKHLDNTNNWLATYDAKHGYYREDALREIRRLMRRKLFGRLDDNDENEDSERHAELDDDERHVMSDFHNEGGTLIGLTRYSQPGSGLDRSEDELLGEDEEEEEERGSGKKKKVVAVKKKTQSKAEKYAVQFQVEMEESLRVRVDERVDELMKGLKEVGGEDVEEDEEFYNLFGSDSN